MKNYTFTSTIFSSLLLLTAYILLNNTNTFLIVSQHTLFSYLPQHINTPMIVFIILFALMLNFISWLFIRHTSSFSDGILSGLIMGLLLSLITGFQLMLSVKQLPLVFLSTDLTNFLLYLTATFTIIGCANGITFNLFAKNAKHAADKNNLYPCHLSTEEKFKAHYHHQQQPSTFVIHTIPKPTQKVKDA